MRLDRRLRRHARRWAVKVKDGLAGREVMGIVPPHTLAPEPYPRKAAPRTTLLIHGGSIAAGFGVNRPYADILAERYASQGLTVVNRAHHGQTSFDGIDYFDREIQPLRPRLLMLHFGIDDCFFPVYRSEFKENLVQMVRLARSRFETTILLPTSHNFDNPYEMDAVNIYYRTIREVAVDLRCELIPVHTYWAGQVMDQGLVNADLVQEDQRYPNERGHALIAQAMLQKIDLLLSGLTRS